MSIDVLVDRTLDELGLLEPGHQRGVADLLLAVTGAGEADGIESFRPLADELPRALGPMAA